MFDVGLNRFPVRKYWKGFPFLPSPTWFIATEATAQISVTNGPGTSMMFRGLRPDSPESFSKERFLVKMREVARNALSQMRDENRLRVAVINFNSPSGSISEEYLHEAEKLIVNDFGGAIQPIILFYRQLASAES